MKKHNYIKYNNEDPQEYLIPMEISVVVNPNASITKTFDTQQIVPIKRSEYKKPTMNTL
jgi:hypothetical protein